MNGLGRHPNNKKRPLFPGGFQGLTREGKCGPGGSHTRSQRRARPFFFGSRLVRLAISEVPLLEQTTFS
jgi:hypothetical protein